MTVTPGLLFKVENDGSAYTEVATAGACQPRESRTMRALLIAVAVILWPILALGEITGPARVIDGDTIEVAGERIRL